MAKAPESIATAGRIAFRVDRFDFGREGRCEVHGSWTGVRGRRFMRPALTLIANDRPVRLLADLAHKPWAAEEGDPWMAAFSSHLTGAEITEAELTVAPDITVALPLPTRRGGAAKRTRSRSGASVPASSQRAPVVSSPERPQSREPNAAALRGQVSELQEDRRRLRGAAERLEEETQAAAARVAELTDRLARVTEERDELRRSRDQLMSDIREARAARDRTVADLEGARRERASAMESDERAREATDRALTERGAALAAQTRAEVERDSAVALRDQAIAERDAALALRDHALAERDAAVVARDRVLSDRDSLVRTNDRLQSELADQMSARRGAALVIRRAAQDPPASRPFALLLPRAIALLILAGVVLVVLALLHVI